MELALLLHYFHYALDVPHAKIRDDGLQRPLMTTLTIFK